MKKKKKGAEGIVKYIDDMGTLHGTWGYLGISKEDKYMIIERANKED